MDWLTFISETVRALAWPCATIIVAILLRKALSNLIERLRRASWKDRTIDFDRELKATEFLAKDTLPEIEHPKGELSRESGLRQIAYTSPAAAVAGAWTDIEAALMTVAERQHLLTAKTLNLETQPIYIARGLMASGRLSGNDYRVFAQLRQLRNLALHGETQITKAEAEEYISLASRFVAKLEKIGTDGGNR